MKWLVVGQGAAAGGGIRCVADNLYVREGDADDDNDKDEFQHLRCNVESFRGMWVPSTDWFHDALVGFPWFNIHKPVFTTTTPATTVRFPEWCIQLLQNTYLLPIPTASQTLDEESLLCKLWLLPPHQFQLHVPGVVLLLLAVVLGACLPHPPVVSEMVHFVMNVHAPLGIKLNPQVDLLFGNFVLLFLDCWETYVWPVLVVGAWAVGLASVAGQLANRGGGGWARFLCLLLGLAFDATTLALLHVTVLHRLLSKICRFQLMVLRTCLLLMRGKKVNVLKRNRVDAMHTDSALLMLGTVAAFFLAFTLQTTVTYHLLLLSWALVGFGVKSLLLFAVQVQLDDGVVNNEAHVKLALHVDGAGWELVAVPLCRSGKVYRLVMPWWRSTFGRVPWINVLQGHELPPASPNSLLQHQ